MRKYKVRRISGQNGTAHIVERSLSEQEHDSAGIAEVKYRA